MKVALYAGMFRRDHDGATRTLYRLAESLHHHEIDIGVWSFSQVDNLDLPVSLFHLPSIQLPFFPDYRFSLPYGRIKRELDAFQPDLIHISVPDLMGLFLLRYGAQKRLPVVASFHTDFPSYLSSFGLQFLQKSLWDWLAWFFNQADIVYAPSRHTANNLEEHGIQGVRIWSRGIDTQIFNPRHRRRELRRNWNADSRPVILYCGRLVPYKGLDVFQGVYDRFQKTAPDSVRFVIAGDGPLREDLQRQMPAAIFTGFLRGTDLSRAYASADLFLFPSATETFGNVVQEAIASGIPAVVSDQGGPQEIIGESGGGLAAAAGDSDDFYSKCRKLLDQPRLHRQLRRNGLDYTQKRTWEMINGRVIRDYRLLVDHPTTASNRSLWLRAS